jgi:anaerobic magnesium-protoporphyrin IX monomethyl ester cyclase
MNRTQINEEVLLINCPISELKEDSSFGSKQALSIPLGISYLAAYLRQNNIGVTLIDALGEGINQTNSWRGQFNLVGLTFDQIIERIPKNINIIGISVNFTSQRQIYLTLLKRIREKYPEKVIIVGGNEATCYPQKYLNKDVDYVLLNESEISLLELVNAIGNKNKRNIKKIESIKGIAYKNKNGENIIQPFCKSNSNLDSLPFPARDLLPLEKYWKKKRGHGPVNKNYTPITSSRGCPFDCSYCSSKVFWKRRWNYRSAENFVAEIEECINKYHITEFEIEDDNFTLNFDRFNQILDLIISKNLNITWTTPNGVRSENLNLHLLKKMKKSGCIHLTLAPESGSQKVLKEVYNKNLDLNQIAKVIKNCNKINLKTCAFFVVGLPTEKVKDKKLTLNYIKNLARLGLDEVGVFPCLPLPKTDVRMKYFSHLNDELIDNDLWVRDIPLWYPRRERVRRYVKKLYFTFLLNKVFFHPFKVIGSFIHIAKNNQSLKMEREIIRRVNKIKEK